MGRASEQRRIEKERAPRGRSEKKREPARPEKQRGQTDEEKKRRDEEERRKIRAEEEQARPAIEELGGESEYSMHEAQHDERGSTHRKRRDGYRREPLTYGPEPDEMARRYLEDATQAPASDPSDNDEEPVLLPHEPEED